MLLLFYLIVCSSVYKLQSKVVKKIEIEDEIGNDYGNKAAKKVILDDETAAVLYQKKDSLFSKGFRVESCTGSRKCKKKRLDRKLKSDLSLCTFEGRLEGDTDSKVSLDTCYKGVSDITIMSDKVDLDNTNFRLHSNGTVEKPEKSFNATMEDQVTKGQKLVRTDEAADVIGQDYAEPNKDDDYAYMSTKGIIVSVRTVNSTCCRPLKTRCENMEKVHTGVGGSSKESVLSCSQKMGRLVCDGRRRTGGDMTCSELKRKIMNIKKLNENTSSEEASSSTAESSLSSSSTESSVSTTSTKKSKPSVFRSNKITNMRHEDLISILTTMKKMDRSKKPNRKCKPDNGMYRGLAVLPLSHKKVLYAGANSLDDTPNDKDPIPKRRIYRERTIEFGIVIDRHLYNQVAERSERKDDRSINNAILRMIHSLMVQVEQFLTHKSISKKKEGFRVRINGVKILKHHKGAEYIKDWDSMTSLNSLLESFQMFANSVNDACDAERESYDAMVLLSGRLNYVNVGSGSTAALAVLGGICTIDPCLVQAAMLSGRQMVFDLLVAKVLAHEVAHLLGVDHDGVKPNDRNSGQNRNDKKTHQSLYYENGVPCPGNRHLMAPIVRPDYTTWSECTRNMVDYEEAIRDRNKTNCLYT